MGLDNLDSMLSDLITFMLCFGEKFYDEKYFVNIAFCLSYILDNVGPPRDESFYKDRLNNPDMTVDSKRAIRSRTVSYDANDKLGSKIPLSSYPQHRTTFNWIVHVRGGQVAGSMETLSSCPLGPFQHLAKLFEVSCSISRRRQENRVILSNHNPKFDADFQLVVQVDYFDFKAPPSATRDTQKARLMERTAKRRQSREQEQLTMGPVKRYKGVRWRPERKDPWVAEIKLPRSNSFSSKMKNKMWIGDFSTAEEAARAYDAAAIHYEKGLNFHDSTMFVSRIPTNLHGKEKANAIREKAKRFAGTHAWLHHPVTQEFPYLNEKRDAEQEALRTSIKINYNKLASIILASSRRKHSSHPSPQQQAESTVHHYSSALCSPTTDQNVSTQLGYAAAGEWKHAQLPGGKIELHRYSDVDWNSSTRKHLSYSSEGFQQAPSYNGGTTPGDVNNPQESVFDISLQNMSTIPAIYGPTLPEFQSPRDMKATYTAAENSSAAASYEIFDNAEIEADGAEDWPALPQFMDVDGDEVPKISMATACASTHSQCAPANQILLTNIDSGIQDMHQIMPCDLRDQANSTETSFSETSNWSSQSPPSTSFEKSAHVQSSALEPAIVNVSGQNLQSTGNLSFSRNNQPLLPEVVELVMMPLVRQYYDKLGLEVVLQPKITPLLSPSSMSELDDANTLLASDFFVMSGVNNLLTIAVIAINTLLLTF